MNEFPPEVLVALFFVQSEEELSDLLDQNEGLDEYFVPFLALMQAINMLSQVDTWEAGSDDEGLVVELVSTPPRGEPVARVVDGSERGAEETVPLMISIAHQSGSNFLNEKGYQLLSALADHEQDKEIGIKLRRYRSALRLCLDQGMDEDWLVEQAAEERRERGESASDSRKENWKTASRIGDLLQAENAREVAVLVEEDPWMKVYVDGIPFQFTPDQQVIRDAVAKFSWSGSSWAQRRRIVLSNPCLISPEALQLLDKIAGLARENRVEQPVHEPIATRTNQDLWLLEKCSSEGINGTFFENAGNYVTGVW